MYVLVHAFALPFPFPVMADFLLGDDEVFFGLGEPVPFFEGAPFFLGAATLFFAFPDPVLLSESCSLF